MHDFSVPRSREYSQNQLIISKYSDGVHTKYKLVYMQTLKNAGVEKSAENLRYLVDPDSRSEYGNLLVLPGDVVDGDGVISCDYKQDGHLSKLPKNVYRARNVIYELAYCNPWDWFFTGTIDGGKHDRSNLDDYRKKFSQMIRNYNRENDVKIKYLIVPELHEDRENWHVHGFLRGLPVEHLKRFQLGDKMSSYIARKVKKGQEVYNWDRYQKSFGFCDLEPVASHDGACKYVTKYISKALDRSVSDTGKHLFYASIGLERRQRVFLGDIPERILDFINSNPATYRGDYCACLWLDDIDSLSRFLPRKEKAVNAPESVNGSETF